MKKYFIVYLFLAFVGGICLAKAQDTRFFYVPAALAFVELAINLTDDICIAIKERNA